MDLFCTLEPKALNEFFNDDIYNWAPVCNTSSPSHARLGRTWVHCLSRSWPNGIKHCNGPILQLSFIHTLCYVISSVLSLWAQFLTPPLDIGLHYVNCFGQRVLADTERQRFEKGLCPYETCSLEPQSQPWECLGKQNITKAGLSHLIHSSQQQPPGM